MSPLHFIILAAIGLNTLDAVSADSCPYISGCTWQDSDCTSLQCSDTFLGESVDLTITLNTCESDVTTTITVTVYSLGIYYTHTFSSEEDVPIPGFSAGPLGGVYLRVKLTRENLSLKLKVSLAVKLLSFGKSITIVNENLGTVRRSIDCGLFEWLSDQPTGAKIGIAIGCLVLFLSFIGCICCCCRGCCCSKPAGGGVVVLPPGNNPVPMSSYPDVEQPATTAYRKF
eukprot:Seg543.24 transcript_id=Seg543.24/GoldUCD/mRNA.D3Y31 product="hypothetical protein" protein_id=Seg543.24/GoldUCD/D3Y31